MIQRNWSGLFVKQSYKNGDVYHDPDKIRRDYEKENKKKIIHEESFRPSSKHSKGLLQKVTVKDGDTYIDPDQIRRNYEKKNKEKIIHEDAFRSTALKKQVLGSTYSYSEHRERRKDPKTYRDDEGKVKLIRSNVMTGPFKGYFTPIEYKEDDFSRKERMRRSEYRAQKAKEFARGLFKSKITIDRPTFHADEAVFGSSEPDPVENLKLKYLKEQALLNCKKTRMRVAARKNGGDADDLLDDPNEGKKPRVFTYVTPAYIKNGFDTRIFARHHALKEKMSHNN